MNLQLTDKGNPQTSISHSGYKKLASLAISLAMLAAVILVSRANILPALGFHRPVSMLEHAGGVQLTEANLKGHVPLPMHMGHHRYWLGPISGFKYTTNCVTPGVLKVGYFTTELSLDLVNKPHIMISAFESEEVFNRNPRPLMSDPESAVLNAHGQTLIFHKSAMTSFTLRSPATLEVITVAYDSPQNIQTMIADSERLMLL